MAKKYIVDLSKDEKAELVSLTQKGRPGARKIKRANILLLVDSGKPDFEVAELLHTSWLTVLRTRQRYVEGGLDFALNELPMRNGKPGRYDYEYRREGTCNLFMFLRPLVGWRHIKVTDQRTKQDFACCMKDLVDIHFPEAERIRVVLDNLNTHSPAAFYEAFSPQQARYLTKKLEFHYTPEHSSWLNMAEVEISVLTEQCLDRRLASQAIVASEVGAWEIERNAVRATIDWRFTIPNARDKLKKLYPVGEE